MVKKTNFLILNKFFYPHKGGVETTVSEHARWIASQKENKVEVLVTNEKPLRATQKYSLNKNLNIILITRKLVDHIQKLLALLMFV